MLRSTFWEMGFWTKYKFRNSNPHFHNAEKTVISTWIFFSKGRTCMAREIYIVFLWDLKPIMKGKSPDIEKGPGKEWHGRLWEQGDYIQVSDQSEHMHDTVIWIHNPPCFSHRLLCCLRAGLPHAPDILLFSLCNPGIWFVPVAGLKVKAWNGYQTGAEVWGQRADWKEMFWFSSHSVTW